MTFLYPTFLWLLLPLAVLLWKRTKDITYIVHLIILMLVVLSLARPIEKHTIKKVPIVAQDMIIALDVSYSMRAKDILPSRYAFAKETIQHLLKNNPTSNVMLIAFTSNPLLLSAPTTDHALIDIALQNLNLEYILTKGTSLENLFSWLKENHLGSKNLILISDGGEESDLHKLTSSMSSDISLTVLALGTKQGTTIQTKETTLLKDTQGNLVISRINPLLETLVSSVNGDYFTASSSAKETADKIDTVLHQKHTDSHMVEKVQYSYAERYQFPLFLALVLFLLLHTSGVKYLMLLFALLGVQVEASFLDSYYLNQAYKSYGKKDFKITKTYIKKIDTPSLQSQMTLANSYFQLGAYKKAITLYQSIHSTSPKIKQQLYYNIANAYVKLKAYDKAKIYYTKTLQLGKEKDALFNLNLIALLSTKKATLGMAHPKSQSSNSSPSTIEEKVSDKTNSEEQSSSSSGAGGKSCTKKKESKQKKLLLDESTQKHPLGSKVYDLINKGYIRETHPW